MPKFQPRIIPKNIQLHDTTKKQHISFDNDDSDNEKSVTPQQKNNNSNNNNNNNNKRSLPEPDQRPLKKSRQGKDDDNIKKQVKKGKDIVLPYVQTVKKPSKQSNSTKTSTPKPKLSKEEWAALEEQRGLAKREANRRKKKEKKKAKQLTKVVNGTTIKRALIHWTPEKLKDNKHHLSIKEIRQFALYCLVDDNPPSFCHVTNRAVVDRVVVVFANGLDIVYFGAPSSRVDVPFSIDLATVSSQDAIAKGNMPFLTSNTFRHMFVTRITGSKGYHLNPASQLLQSNVTQSRKNQLLLERKELLEKKDIDRNTLFTLGVDELKAYGYPIPPFLDASVTLPEGWKETRPALEPTDKKKLIAMDCEMVLTEKGRALARISLVDEDGNILLDEYVRPDEPIIDYLTEYSGITPKIMAQTECSLRRAQKHVRKIVDHNVILIGHSLDSDLNALQLAHPYCADTSVLYDSYRGPPFKPALRNLATTYLQRRIQVNHKEKKGHNSAEDALATMDLFKLKVEKGFMFGRKKEDLEVIFDRFYRYSLPRKGMILESNNGIQTFQSGRGVEYENVATDEQLTDQVIQHINKDQNFILAKYDNLKFKELEEGDIPPIVLSNGTVDRERAKKLAMFDQSIKKIYDEAPQNTAIVVMGGIGYVPNYIRLLHKQRKYKEFMALRKTGEEDDIEEIIWTNEDQKQFELESEKAKLSCTFVTIK